MGTSKKGGYIEKFLKKADNAIQDGIKKADEALEDAVELGVMTAKLSLAILFCRNYGLVWFKRKCRRFDV